MHLFRTTPDLDDLIQTAADALFDAVDTHPGIDRQAIETSPSGRPNRWVVVVTIDREARTATVVGSVAQQSNDRPEWLPLIPTVPIGRGMIR